MLGGELYRDDSQAEAARRRLYTRKSGLECGIDRIHQDGDDRKPGHQLAQQLQPLRAEQAAAEERHARKVALRPAEAGDETHLHRIVTDDEHDRDGRHNDPGRL